MVVAAVVVEEAGVGESARAGTQGPTSEILAKLTAWFDFGQQGTWAEIGVIHGPIRRRSSLDNLGNTEQACLPRQGPMPP